MSEPKNQKSDRIDWSRLRSASSLTDSNGLRNMCWVGGQDRRICPFFEDSWQWNGSVVSSASSYRRNDLPRMIPQLTFLRSRRGPMGFSGSGRCPASIVGSQYVIRVLRSAFSSRLHARVLPLSTAIGPLRSSRIQLGVRKTARRVLLQRWHEPRTVIFGWEVPRSVSVRRCSLRALPASVGRPIPGPVTCHFWPFPMGTFGSAFHPEGSAFCGMETPRTIVSAKECQTE